LSIESQRLDDVLNFIDMINLIIETFADNKAHNKVILELHNIIQV